MVLIVIKSCMAHVEIIYDTCAWNDERYKGYIIYALTFYIFYHPNIKVKHKPVPTSSKTLATEKSTISIFYQLIFYLPLINRHINKTTQLPFKLNSRHFHIFESILMKIFILHKSFVSNFHCNFLFMCLNISSWCGKLLDSDYSSK